VVELSVPPEPDDEPPPVPVDPVPELVPFEELPLLGLPLPEALLPFVPVGDPALPPVAMSPTTWPSSLQPASSSSAKPAIRSLML
jgi:hypothetical protein